MLVVSVLGLVTTLLSAVVMVRALIVWWGNRRDFTRWRQGPTKTNVEREFVMQVPAEVSQPREQRWEPQEPTHVHGGGYTIPQRRKPMSVGRAQVFS